MTLSQTYTLDRIESHPPSCAACGEPLLAAEIEGEPQRRRLFELPSPPSVEVIKQ